MSMSSEKTGYAQLAESSSDTESLLENDAQRTGPAQRRFSISPWQFTAAFLMALTILNIIFLSTRPSPKNCRPLDVSDDIFPAFEYEEVLFHDDNLIPGPESDKSWNEEMPHGFGFTIVDDPDKYNLPPGLAYGDGFNDYGVSWAHQYHCLWMLRRAFFELIDGKSPLLHIDILEQSKEGAELWHLSHCFGYLRQHILCNMDMSLEWPVLGDQNEGTINGYEIPHQCKKREPLDRYMDEHGPQAKFLVKPEKDELPSHVELTEVHTRA